MKYCLYSVISLFLIIMASCSARQSENESQYLSNLYESIFTEYQNVKTRSLNAIAESETEENLEIKHQIELLDSLLLQSIQTLRENPIQEHIEFYNAAKEMVFPNAILGFSPFEEKELQNPDLIKLEVIQLGKNFMETLAVKINVTSLHFDKVEILIEPEKTNLLSGESFKGKVYLGAYSKNTGEVFDFYLDGQALEVKDGIGYFDVLPNKNGSQKMKFKIASKKGFLENLTNWKKK